MGNIIIFGPPGAGKGTQANNAVNEFNLFKVSTGDILRNEIDKKTKFGEIIKLKIDQGLFVDDKIINRLIEDILKNKIFVGLSCKYPYLYRDRGINKWLGLNNSCPKCRYKWKKNPFENYNTKDLLNLLE